jgi:S-adenosylmethionine:tRNA ribosyltransferase-isomerase
MLVTDFDYNLPRELIAQQPLEPRDSSRLLVLDRADGSTRDAQFRDIRRWLKPGDVLVLNNTKVIPARVFGKLATGATLELLLLRQLEPGMWEVLTRPGRKAKPGAVVQFGGFSAQIVERRPDGLRVVRFTPPDITEMMRERGGMPLPPYIREECRDPGRYQTVFAKVDGAVAAPTAGLHFTPELLENLNKDGIETASVTLHAGLGTFRPVKADNVEEHAIHEEEFELDAEAADKVNRALAEGRRVVCVGTTTVRVLEGQARAMTNDECRVSNGGWRVKAGKGMTKLYIFPGYEWKVAGALLTNFHLPKSTLLMLVSSFAGRERVLEAYRHAIEQKYRFYSFGDAMLVV